MNDIKDSYEQFLLHKKQMFKHLKDCLIFNFKNRKEFYFLKFLTLIGLSSLVVLFGYFILIYSGSPLPEKIIKPKIEIVYLEDSTKTMEAFLDKLGEMESRNNYKALNRFGYMGKYQIGFTALKQIGLGSVSKERFLNTPELQEAAMKMLLRENKRILSNYIGKYQSQTINGIYITESSILAAAQMAPAGTIKFLTSKGDSVFRDGNGVPITKYLKQFSGYKIIL